jgi:hypothetical protein
VPHKWQDALNKFGEDTLAAYGIIPAACASNAWQADKGFQRKKLFFYFEKQCGTRASYCRCSFMPSHACENHNGQFTDQKGIHAFWESRVPELLADKKFDFLLAKLNTSKIRAH